MNEHYTQFLLPTFVHISPIEKSLSVNKAGDRLVTCTPITSHYLVNVTLSVWPFSRCRSLAFSRGRENLRMMSFMSRGHCADGLLSTFLLTQTTHACRLFSSQTYSDTVGGQQHWQCKENKSFLFSNNIFPIATFDNGEEAPLGPNMSTNLY